jgi:hypothetical protein
MVRMARELLMLCLSHKVALTVKLFVIYVAKCAYKQSSVLTFLLPYTTLSYYNCTDRQKKKKILENLIVILTFWKNTVTENMFRNRETTVLQFLL